MRKTLILSFLLLLNNSLQAQDIVRIIRWISPITGDFETLREDINTDAQLQGWGYKDKLYQFSAYKTRPNDPNATAVNRWVMPNCAASIVIAEHEIPEATLLSWGYKSKQVLFYAYRTKPASGDFVAVNRWINAKPQGDKCRDFTLTVAETELTDAQLISYGYSGKITQFYVPRPVSASGLVSRPPTPPTPGVPTSTTAPTQPTVQNIRLQNINEWLCPNRLTRGDREFDGHGPHIKSEVKLRIGDGGQAIYADITFWAQETQHDWSTAEGKWTRKVYDAPVGKRIFRIVSDQISRTQFIGNRAGGFGEMIVIPISAENQVGSAVGKDYIGNEVFAVHGLQVGNYKRFYALGQNIRSGSNGGLKVPALQGAAVKFFSIVGDTGNGDISDDDNCDDDTRITGIEFAPAKVEFVNQQN